MYGTLASSSRASAAEILASCIRLITPSIMRAPPEAETMISGVCVSQRALDRPRNRLADHRAHAAADERILHRARQSPGVPFSLPRALIDRIVQSGIFLRLLQPRRVGLQVDELQRIGRSQIRRRKSSYSLSSSSCARRVRASIRKCLSHFGQTFRFSSRSFFQMICRQLLTLHPQPFGADILLARSVQLAGFAFKPSHKEVVSCQCSVVRTAIPALSDLTEQPKLATDY